MLIYIDCNIQSDVLNWLEMHAIIHQSIELNGKSKFTQKEIETFNHGVFNSFVQKNQSGNQIVIKEN